MSYEALFDEKSNFNNFKIIDCQVWIFISKKKHSKFDFRFSNCRLLEYAASMQYILYEMNSDWVIFSYDVIFDESSEFYLSNWIFNFNFSDKFLLSICFYTQKFLFLKTNIKFFSASHVIDYVEVSTAELSVKLLMKSSAELSIKSCEK